jgi:hypothetical protein
MPSQDEKTRLDAVDMNVSIGMFIAAPTSRDAAGFGAGTRCGMAPIRPSGMDRTAAAA